MAQLNESHGRIKAPPRTDDINVLRSYVAELADMFAKLAKDLDFIINGNLDVKNIRANSITANALDVDKLSAITANLGEINAGIIRGIQIFGSKFATSEDSYPRVEISESDDLIRVMLTPTNFIEFTPNYSLSDRQTPTIRFFRDGKEMVLGYGAGTSDFMGLRANDAVVISSLLGVFIPILQVSNWDLFINNQTTRTLQQEFNSLTNSINALTSAINSKANSGSSTSSAGGWNGGIAPGTVLMKFDGTPVTWNGIPSHSHTQN